MGNRPTAGHDAAAPPMTAHFHTTRWSVVARSGASDMVTAQRALGELCEQYWFPLYAHARRSGRDDADASDLVQSFCADLLGRGGMAQASPEHGRFRHYLLGAFTHFVRNTARTARTQKRGGDVAHQAWHEAAARYEPEADAADGPEQVFTRRWAFAVLDRAMARLREDYATPSRTAWWTELQPLLLAAGERTAAAAVAARLGATEGAVRVALHRLRQRWRELVRDEIAQTVADPAEIDDELAALQAALAMGRPPSGA